jgi:RHS repeat-associated protein
MKKALRKGAIGCALLAGTMLTAPAPVLAQSPPPRFSQVDGNGVDLVTVQHSFSFTEGGIGSGEGGLSLTTFAPYGDARTQWTGLLYRLTSGGTSLMYVEFGPIAETFTISGSTYTSTLANGGTLAGIGNGQYRYTSSDGTRIVFESDYQTGGVSYNMGSPLCSVGDEDTCAVPISITRPNGMTFTLDWTIVPHCDGYDGGTCINPTAYFRFAGVTSSANYRFTLSYATDSFASGSWYIRTGASFTNLASAPSPLPSSSWAYSGGGVVDVTDTGGRTWRFTNGSGTFSIRRPGSSSADVTVTTSGGYVTQVVRDGVTTTYSRSVSGSTLTLTVTTGGNATTVVSNLTTGLISSITDPTSRTTSYQYDGNGRLTRVTMPEGNSIGYTYDARGNIAETRLREKGDDGDPPDPDDDIVTSANYLSSCSNPVVCNSPTSTTDARGNTTDYTWDSTHGGPLTVTAPAPTSGATRPQTRYTYSQVTAVTGQPVYLPTNISACQTTSSCNGQADEAEANISYNTSNLLPTSVSRGSGNGALVATEAMTYDSVGNLLTVDGPLDGSADTARYRYNAARQVVGVAGPDPDGGGSLKHRAVRVTYGSDGQPTKVERGTVNSQSDGDWASFATLEEVQQSYDSNHRPTVRRAVSGGTTYELTQASYDNAGRLHCVAQRMNPSEFDSLPSGACTLDTQGSYGPDRITRYSYDGADRVVRVEEAVDVTGTWTSVADTTHTSNGQAETVTDGEGNMTTFVYDGFDRRVRIRYPSPTTDGASSTTDYEELTLDRNGNVTSHRLRDTNSIGMTYDTLGRPTERDRPGSELTQTYSYDLLGRMTGASQTGNALSFTFDALGRNLTQAGPRGTNTYVYDIAGRRTRMTYADSGLYIDYDYNVVGDITAIRENGATTGVGVLATYGYDDRGRRTSVTRGNGTSTSYSYDAVSRPTQITQDLTSGGSDLTLTMTYNPAGQILTRAGAHGGYAWTSHYAVNRNYTANGLNQYTGVGAITPTYDTRGNLTSAGSTTYAYDSDNALTGVNGYTNLLSYDPLGRLYDISVGTTRRMAYDGQNLVAEYNSSNVLQRRFVHGPGSDEPIVWYEGTGTSDRRWFHADERGSIVTVSDGNGAALAYMAYDDYGIPQHGGYGGAQYGRFGYTGQVWLTELGLQHSRNRTYSPTLGRFLQTDPIGFAGGMNLYGYVGNDPINLRDPLGLVPEENDPIIVTATQNGFTPVPNPMFTVEINGLFQRAQTLGNVADPEIVVTATASTGGAPGGQTGSRATPPPSETPTCRDIRRRVENTRGDLPSYITNSRFWNSSHSLTVELVSARMNLADANSIAMILGIGAAEASGAAANRNYRPSRGGSWASIIAGAVAGGYVSYHQNLAQRQVEALRARLAQLQAQADGTCLGR